MAERGSDAPDGMLTQYALRKRVEVSHDQLSRYMKWGLIDDPIDGRWPEATAERIREIHRAEPRARRLERRAVLLGVRNPEKRRAAMVELAKIMKAPKLKVRRLQRAARQLDARPVPTDPFGNPLYWHPSPPKNWRFPEPSVWPAVLRNPLTRERFEWISQAAYYSARALLAQQAELTAVLKGIPDEEVVLILVIQELSMQQAMLRETMREQNKKK